MSYWRDYSSSGPIAVEGGIKAKSKRGAIGERWWSRRFIAFLESSGMSGRLQRGRSYARRGQVIEFSLHAGKVTARVQGSRPQPYQVSITVRPLTVGQWRAVEARLASQALFRARLLAGEMPAEIERVFADCGAPLFPEPSRDLTMSCNCPDWGVRASTWPRSATCSPSHSTMTRSPCSPCAARDVTACSPRCAARRRALPVTSRLMRARVPRGPARPKRCCQT